MDDLLKAGMLRTNSADELHDMMKEKTGYEKDGKISYVLVPNELQGLGLVYYAGYFIDSGIPSVMLPKTTMEYVEAAKYCFKDEAQQLCDIINKLKCATKFHVEEHMYSNSPISKLMEKVKQQ